MRLGAVPLTEVNKPNPLLTRYRSSQYGKKARPWFGAGRQVFVKVLPEVAQQIINTPEVYYFNVHSTINPGGVARGQLQRVQ